MDNTKLIAAQEQRIAELEGALGAMLNQRDRDIQAGRMQSVQPSENSNDTR